MRFHSASLKAIIMKRKGTIIAPFHISVKKHYSWLWFDADGTLFDYYRAEGRALEQAFQALHLPFDGTALDTYRLINRQLWDALERRELTQADLQTLRFERLLDTLNCGGDAAQLGAAYLQHLANAGDLIDGANDVLCVLKETHRIAIVTNGLATVQRGRLARSGIGALVDEVIISEEIGIAKPYAGFFDVVFARTGNPSCSEVLVIGDSLTSDMRGGLDYGLDTCWFNPAGAPRPDDLPVTYEIRAFGDLLEILG
jgi:2-haloacid dehalogenase